MRERREYELEKKEKTRKRDMDMHYQKPAHLPRAHLKEEEITAQEAQRLKKIADEDRKAKARREQ